MIFRFLSGGMLVLVLFGCLMPVSEPPAVNQTQEIQNATFGCRKVVSQEPYSEEVCQNVSKMEEVCENRELDYSLAPVEKNFVCIDENLCVDQGQDGTCYRTLCSKGMTRCRSNITNLDAQKTGTWSVEANFSFQSGSVFRKNPIIHTLLPNEIGALDFEQSYEMGLNQNKPECTIYVSVPARLQDCNFISKVIESCENVTKNRTIEKEVCG